MFLIDIPDLRFQGIILSEKLAQLRDFGFKVESKQIKCSSYIFS